MLPHRVVIIATDNGGYIVQVGCKTLVFADTPSMISELQRYLLSPEMVGKEYAAKHQWGPKQPPLSAMPLGALNRPVGGPYYTGQAMGLGGGGSAGGYAPAPVEDIASIANEVTQERSR